MAIGVQFRDRKTGMLGQYLQMEIITLPLTCMRSLNWGWRGNWALLKSYDKSSVPNSRLSFVWHEKSESKDGGWGMGKKTTLAQEIFLC
ncbi:hypothetical protein Syun_022742 [Stephania yunnanensis]|uniref:Uncharacterized protein n=1 Tax=Stephania yunnanensis TaxID=152371 RepID=A0AAP0F7K6_9MAGN